jgi:glutathione peroxidase
MLSFSAISAQNLKTFHQFSVKTIDGDSISLSVFKGKKVLVVNTASKCGFTPQYKELEELYAQYGGDNFVIVGFPSNNFLSQEPGSNSEIKEFCKKNYGVSFPMMEKISVKGKNIHPLYQWLTQKEENGVSDAKVQWNFQKFLIDEDGKWIGVVAPSESPKCDKIIQWLNNK